MSDTMSFNKDWKKSKKPNKQRKYIHNAPKHIKAKQLRVNLSPELRERYETRNVRVRKGDVVRVKRGDRKGEEGQVLRVDVDRQQLFVEGIEHTKKEGPMLQVPLKPSNVQIVELNMDDSKRVQKMEKYGEQE